LPTSCRPTPGSRLLVIGECAESALGEGFGFDEERLKEPDGVGTGFRARPCAAATGNGRLAAGSRPARCGHRADDLVPGVWVRVVNVEYQFAAAVELTELARRPAQP
jgi:hypothetical protein